MAFHLVGLLNTGIAATGARRLLSALGTTVPSVSGLQKMEVNVGTLLSMKELEVWLRREQLSKKIQELQGFDRKKPNAVELDRQINNCLRHCRTKTQFVPATQQFG